MLLPMLLPMPLPMLLPMVLPEHPSNVAVSAVSV